MTPLLAAVLGACAPKPEPRTVFDFMDDGFAREGVLTRCNQDRDATLTDEECANARRAAAAVALEAERARAPALEEESEAKLVALRNRVDQRAAAEQDAAAAAHAAAEAGYEARWPEAAGRPPTSSTVQAPAFGTPVGSVMPSMSKAPSFDVYADGADTLARPEIELAVAEPPPNELVIEAPRLEKTDLAVLPRPFRDDAAQR